MLRNVTTNLSTTFLKNENGSMCCVRLFSTQKERIAYLENDWKSNPRWRGVTRPYTAKDVIRLSGSLPIEHTIAKEGSKKFWKLINEQPFVGALGAVTGNQAMQQVKAGLKSIYISGWQTAADANISGEMYPDQSLYPANSVPNLVRNVNKTLQRADQIHHAEGDQCVEDWFVPLVADAEAGFGGVLNAFEIMKAMIDAGASAVHFEDQLASVKKCGHMGKWKYFHSYIRTKNYKFYFLH